MILKIINVRAPDITKRIIVNSPPIFKRMLNDSYPACYKLSLRMMFYFFVSCSFPKALSYTKIKHTSVVYSWSNKSKLTTLPTILRKWNMLPGHWMFYKF